MSVDIINLLGEDRVKIEKSSGKLNDGCIYAISAMQGWRNEMEDAHIATTHKCLPSWSFYAVFDGHGGDFCSNYSSKVLYEKIIKNLTETRDLNTLEDYSNDLEINNSIISAIKNGFLDTDIELKKKKTNEDKSGTTVVACLINPKYIFLINSGDSRGLYIKGNEIEISTFDHKPNQLTERKRIQNAGGIVALHRVNGGLATSRGLGDFEYKNVENLEQFEQFVSPEPDIYISQKYSDSKYIILGCDGIFDVLKNEDLKNFIDKKLASLTNVEENNLLDINKDVLHECLKKGSRDNMSIIIIYFKQNKEITPSRQISNHSDNNRFKSYNSTL